MGRIDDAIRRGGGPLADAQAPPVHAVDAFVSPWTDDYEPTHVAKPRAVSTGEGTGRHLPVATATAAVATVAVAAPAVVTPQPAAARLSVLDGFKTDWRARLAVSSSPDPLLVDQFRRLAGTLLHNPNELKTILVTSASPGDGKTLTALNLALVLSESYRRRVLLIEGDLRRPAISAAAGLPTSHGGLADVLKSSHDRKVTLVQLTDNLTLMPAGRPDPDPLSGLTSPRLRHLLEEASAQFDWVILDTPPIGAGPDASLMLPLADAALLVVRARTTPHAVVKRAVDVLGADRILGVVLNAVGPDVVAGYDCYYSDYSAT